MEKYSFDPKNGGQLEWTKSFNILNSTERNETSISGAPLKEENENNVDAVS